MTMSRRALLLILSVLAVGPLAQAQAKKDKLALPDVISPRQAPPKGATTSSLKSDILWLLESLSSQTGSLEDKTLQIRTRAEIADALWTLDQPRARRRFTEAFKLISQIEQPEITEGNDRFSTEVEISRSPRFMLRNELLLIVARRDLAFSQELASSVEDESTDVKGDSLSRNLQNERTMLNLELARSIAPSSPDKAAALVMQSLNGGVSYQLIGTLLTIKEHRPDLADQLFREVVATAKQNPGAGPASVVMLWLYLNPRFEGNRPAPVIGDGPATLEFLDLVFSISLAQLQARAQRGSVTGDSDISSTEYTSLQEMLPLFDRLMPDRSVVIRERLKTVGGESNAEATNNSASSGDRTTIEDLLDKAERTPLSRNRDELYMEAIAVAMDSLQIDKALSIAEKIADVNDRAVLKSLIHFQAALKALSDADSDRALQFAREISVPGQRVTVFGLLAEHFLDRDNRSKSSELLKEIESWLLKIDDPSRKADGMLEVVAAVIAVEPKRGFEVMRAAIKAINGMSYSSKPVKGISGNASRLQLVEKGYQDLDLRTPFSALAKLDFFSTLSLAQSLERKEMAVIAQLSACQGALAESEKEAKQGREKKGVN